MKKRIKISVCGVSQDVVEIVYEALKKIPTFEVVNSDNFQHTDIIYWIYGKGPSIKKFLPVWIKKEPIIINHWIGSDVTGEINNNNKQGIDRIKKSIQDYIFYRKWKSGGLINLTSAPWLVNELSKINIGATYLAITTLDVEKLGKVDDHPEKDIDFLSYVPFRRFEFYGGDKIINLANRWQNFKFFLICIDLREIPPDLVEKMPKNVILSPCVNRSQMVELYKRSKFFIRNTQHDAVSLSVLEALYFKLQVLWTYDFPFTHKIHTQKKLSDSLPDLVLNWHPNEDGHEFVVENYTTDTYRNNFIKIIQNIKL